ncbi:MAG TPA: VOC family protein [Steroidobacteraceae bacterium]|jgi:methylmalonyl-CoA/ethylmalonyl-CoA epimerase|nr:VOC family protein [Steroidobacteraceae bacterium]
MVALSQIGQIAVNVRDLPRAVNFYRDVLGMRHLFDAGPKLSFFDCGGVRLMLGPAEQPEFDHPGSILYYRVADLEAAYQELLAKGVRFQDAPHLIAKMPTYELWMAFARDTEENLFALMAEITPPRK